MPTFDYVRGIWCIRGGIVEQGDGQVLAVERGVHGDGVGRCLWNYDHFHGSGGAICEQCRWQFLLRLLDIAILQAPRGCVSFASPPLDEGVGHVQRIAS